jgi:hypothetical protein
MSTIQQTFENQNQYRRSEAEIWVIEENRGWVNFPVRMKTGVTNLQHLKSPHLVHEKHKTLCYIGAYPFHNLARHQTTGSHLRQRRQGALALNYLRRTTFSSSRSKSYGIMN